MSFSPRKSTQRAAVKPSVQRPLYVGKIRADRYAQSLLDPDVRATLAKASAKAKGMRPT
jgi:hypothetical protein